VPTGPAGATKPNLRSRVPARHHHEPSSWPFLGPGSTPGQVTAPARREPSHARPGWRCASGTNTHPAPAFSMTSKSGYREQGRSWNLSSGLLRRGAGKSPLLILVLACLTACFSERSDDPAEPEVREDTLVEVRLTNFAFTPASIVINRGTRVRWINTTNTFHTVTPDGHSEWQRWPTSASSDTLEHIFASPGDFAYFCEPHRTIGMSGSITVR